MSLLQTYHAICLGELGEAMTGRSCDELMGEVLSTADYILHTNTLCISVTGSELW